MNETVRSFVAIECPEAIKQAMVKIQDEIRKGGGPRGGHGDASAGISWTRTGGFHLTLKFFGDLPQSRVSEVGEAIGAVAGAFRPFEVFLEGAGVFPHPKAPRVLWVGIRSGGDELSRLQTAIEERLEALGFGRETRPFRPHLTLGRIRQGGGRGGRSSPGKVFAEWSERNRETRFGTFSVREVVLMKSDLQPGGAVYTPLSVRGLASA